MIFIKKKIKKKSYLGNKWKNPSENLCAKPQRLKPFFGHSATDIATYTLIPPRGRFSELCVMCHNSVKTVKPESCVVHYTTMSKIVQQYTRKEVTWHLCYVNCTVQNLLNWEWLRYSGVFLAWINFHLYYMLIWSQI